MDYFNDEERERQREFARARDEILKPVSNLLIRARVTPNQVTLLSIAMLVAGCVLGPGTGLPETLLWVPALLLLLYCVLDGIDGSLARQTGRCHQGGTIVDMAADQLGTILVPAAAFYHLGSNGVAAILFSNFYIAFIIIVIFANTTKITLPRYLRVKYFLYAIYGLSLVTGFDWAGPFMAVFAVYYAMMIPYAVLRIYRFYDHKK